jgi:hypothetical protein
LAAHGFHVEHGYADDLGGERPEAELPGDFRTAQFARNFIRLFLSFAEEILLLSVVEGFDGKRARFDVENQFGHGAERKFGSWKRENGERVAKAGWQSGSKRHPNCHPDLSQPYFFLAAGFLAFAGAFLAADFFLTATDSHLRSGSVF